MALNQEQARKLAVSYHAFMSAKEPEESGFWAWMLEETQIETGIDLVRYSLLAHYRQEGDAARQKRIESEGADDTCDDGQGVREDYSSPSGEMESCE